MRSTAPFAVSAAPAEAEHGMNAEASDKVRTYIEGAVPSDLKSGSVMRKLLILWAMLVAGHAAGMLLYCGLPTTFEDAWLVAVLPVSAIVFAAIGPLSIVMYFMALFRVQGGTATAILSLLCGTPLFLWTLFLLVRKMMKTEHRFSQWLLRVALASYSALSTFALLYGCYIT